ncbi:peptide chain release factor N(5)-glutamine methyltransferase [Lactobacillus sp. Sy-1]|uniref:peptide chain release factor N(5)-glutamine methyltransferase n=1 Tax=Lactobacillus sp. Sy-1 TaxID=2109645 RepID=UPI001C5AE52E|nr:peptide chain release factor N(5)-glutamine methyltransferase [Lactobacillus sp. Sy-1]MBW1605847.1 peptide chain release factor N(5)-glutamine methyltransferase [Lactobacillus sp. Sy-1]
MANPITFFEAQKRASLCIKDHGMDPTVAHYLLIHRLNWSDTDLLLHYRDLMTTPQLAQYRSDIECYLDGQPPQYIIGTAEFYGHVLKVSPDVLIPRPETEELVDWILETHPDDLQTVLDLGTGSGAIAIALQSERPKWDITGSDVSAAALNIARENINVRNLPTKLVLSDLFSSIFHKKYDLIVSNPPYISENEVKYMDESVINFEPHLALFAEDNGLALYQGIADHFRSVAKPHGEIFLEIGFHQESAVVDIFQRAVPDAKIETRKDFNGNQRMVRIKY